jgi:serine protease Do
MVGLSRRTVEFKVFPIKAVRESLQQLRKKEGGVLESGWIGVYIDAADLGVQVTRVVPDSPALEVGIRAGDTIVAIDERPLFQVEDFIQAVKWIGPEKNVSLTVERDKSRKNYDVVLGRTPVYQKPAYEWALDIPPAFHGAEQLSKQVSFRPVPSFQRRSIGIQVGPLTSQLAEFFKSPTGKGLLVEAVETGSLAEQIGLKAGDVIILIDDITVKTSSDLSRIMNAFQEPVFLSFVRDGKVQKQKVLFR